MKTVRAECDGPSSAVEDQGAAYQSEAEPLREERNQHSGREARNGNESIHARCFLWPQSGESRNLGVKSLLCSIA
jgi:hypothetical protein